VVNWARLRRRGERKSFWLWVVVPVIGIVVLAIPVWGDLRPGQPSPYNIMPWLALALIAAGIGYAYVLGRLRPDVLANAPALLEGESDEALDASGSSALAG
jgi:nitrate reductase gamma subunit